MITYRFIALALVIVITGCTLEATAQEPVTVSEATAPVMKILLKPGAMSEATGSGVLDVDLSVPGMHVAAGQPLFTLNWMAPGMSRPQAVDNLIVTDAQGAVPLEMNHQGKAEWRSTRAVDGDVRISYRVPIDNRNESIMPASPRVDGDGFTGSGYMFLLAPVTAKSYRVAIRWDLSAMGRGAAGVSNFGEGDVDLPAGLLSRLHESVFMAGHIKRQDEAGSLTALWLGDLPEDLHPAMAWAGKLHGFMIPHFKNPDPLRVFLRVSNTNPGGGMATGRAFVLGYGKGLKGDEIQSLLGHEMVHTFTSNDMGKWYTEGDAVYYQLQLPWRAGLQTTDEYLRDINLTAASYYTNPRIAVPDDRMMDGYWTDPFLIMLPYDRGAMYFAILDGKIRRASGGKRSVDDLVRTMVSRSRAGQPADELVWEGLLREALGDEGPAVHKAMMTGAILVPDSDAFGPCFRRVPARIRRFEQGFVYKHEPDPGRGRLVESVNPGSEAEKAGIRVGDRVTLHITTSGAYRDPEMTVDAQVTRDGKHFTVTYLPRGAAIDAYQWERVPGSPDTGIRP